MRKTVGPIFEHACHEGNLGLYNTLVGARLEEKRAAEEALKKGSKWRCEDAKVRSGATPRSDWQRWLLPC